MNSIHKQPLCYGKNQFSQDDLRSYPRKCSRCKQMLNPEDVFDCVRLIDCVTVIRVMRGSKLDFLFSA
jgi:hypothetical protein